MGSLSLLQWIFVTQEWNQGLLRYKQILYQLSYEGSTKACGLRHGSRVLLYSPVDFAKCTVMSCIHRDSVIHSRFTVPIRPSPLSPPARSQMALA